jgi:hypothetical protein
MLRRPEDYRMPSASWVLTDVAKDLYTPEFSVRSADLGVRTDRPWSVRKRTLRGGLREGVDLIEVDNGALSFSVVPTRGMGLWKGRYNGLELGWKAPVKGPVHPAYVDPAERGGIGWIAGFDEWICRCGLNSNGAPGEDVVADNNGNPQRVLLPLHGKIANLPANFVKVRVGLAEPHEIQVVGYVEESMLFSPQLQLRSTVTTAAGSNTLTIRDEVVNLRRVPAELELLYHCNFGPPFLEAGARLVAPFREVAPRDKRAQEGIDGYDVYPEPVPGFVEQCYWFDLLTAPGSSRTLAMLRNAAADKALVLRWDRSQMPCFTLWKNPGALEDGYVTGLEPGTNYPNPKKWEREQGRVIRLPPGGSYAIALTVEVCDRAGQVAAVQAEIAGIRKQAAGVVHKTPQAKYWPA